MSDAARRISWRIGTGQTFLAILLALFASCDLGSDLGGDKDSTAALPDAALPDTSGTDTSGTEGGAPDTAIRQGAKMVYKDTELTWDTEDAFYKDKYVIVDLENRKIVFQDNPQDVAKYGEMEVTWDAPPQLIPDGFQFVLNYGVAITKVPTWNAGVGITPGYSPVWYFEEPNGNPGKIWAGMNANLELIEGTTKQITLKASNLPNRIGEEGWMWFNIGNATVSYRYVIEQ